MCIARIKVTIQHLQSNNQQRLTTNEQKAVTLFAILKHPEMFQLLDWNKISGDHHDSQILKQV